MNQMKTKLFIASAAVAALVATGFSTRAQAPRLNGSNPGIVMAGSQNYESIPSKAKHFVEKHFKGVGITKCEQYFAKGKYEVELSNGVDIEFNTKGEVTEVDAPDNAFLPTSVVRDLLHRSAYSHLEKDGLEAKVESIEFKKGKAVEVEVSIPDPDTFIFDIDGNFIAIQD